MCSEKLMIPDDGIQLSAVLEKPDGAEPAALAILLHGFTSAKDRIHNIQAAEAMRNAGLATLRLDLYGHGESGGEFRKHTLYKWISNTLTAIDWAREQGYQSLFLSGHSQGGLTAALAAGMEADRIRGLILRAPAFMIPQAARDGMMLGYSFDPDRVPAEIGVIKDLILDGNYIRVAQTIHPEEAAERFQGPVLILHGDQDDVVPPEVSLKMSERYAHSELTVIEGETHHFDQKPERMKELITDWLRGLPSSCAGSAPS